MLLKEVFIQKTHSWKLFEAEGKNTHPEHIEDLVSNNGYDGAVRALEYLDAVKGLLEGGSQTGKLTVKWDGAPAIIRGIDPRRWESSCRNKSSILIKKIKKSKVNC